MRQSTTICLKTLLKRDGYTKRCLLFRLRFYNDEVKQFWKASILFVSLLACSDDTELADPDAGGSVARDCSGGPLEAPIPGCKPRLAALSDDLAADCVARINQFRWECQCLPPLGRWTGGESCANEQAAYDAAGNGHHAGAEQGICSPSGIGQNECPQWTSTRDILGSCLQAMWDEGPGEPFEEHGHYINMTNSAYSEVACGFATDSSGARWSVQNFR